MKGRKRGEKNSDKEAGRDYISTVNIDNKSEEIKVSYQLSKSYIHLWGLGGGGG